MVQIAPSILSADFLRLGDEVRAAQDAGADLIHVDVMDGMFVPNITIGPFIVEAVRKATDLPLDVHLMIERPERYVDEFVSAGADYLVVHAEAVQHLHSTIHAIKDRGAKAGVSVNPATPITVFEYILQDIDLALVMSVNPGFGGQSFIHESLRKISELRNVIDERSLSTLLEVDGGIKPDNVKQVVRAGADVIVMGSAFFGSKDYNAVVRQVRETLSDG